MNDLCKDNQLCCDDNCQRCAQLIYQEYLKNKSALSVARAFIHNAGLDSEFMGYAQRRLGNDH